MPTPPATHAPPASLTALPNGLRVACEPMPAAATVAVRLALPLGIASEPADQPGVAPLLEELLLRGTESLDSRALSDALDRLGVQRFTSLESRHLHLTFLCLGPQLADALPLLADLARRPRLDPAELEPARDLCLQSIESLADEPEHRVGLLLRHAHHPTPFNRSPLGTSDYLAAATIGHARAFHAQGAVPGGAVLAVAGAVEEPALLDAVHAHFGDWTGAADPIPYAGPRQRGTHHETDDSEQTHIALACDAPVDDADDPHHRADLQRLAAACLSGGSSARLFTEVREKRGLCYSVYAAYTAEHDRGMLHLHAGTTPDRAQETLDVSVAELRRLTQGVTDDEFARAQIGFRARLVMQGESTPARAGSLARDILTHGKPRPLADRAAAFAALTRDQLNDFLAAHPPGELTLATLGRDPLNPPS